MCLWPSRWDSQIEEGGEARGKDEESVCVCVCNWAKGELPGHLSTVTVHTAA